MIHRPAAPMLFLPPLLLQPPLTTADQQSCTYSSCRNKAGTEEGSEDLDEGGEEGESSQSKKVDESRQSKREVRRTCTEKCEGLVWV